MPAHLLRNMAVAVRTWIPDSRMPHYLGALLPDSALEECEGVVKYLDEKLRQKSEEDMLCLELTVQYLLRWGENHVEDAGEKSSRYAELVLIVQSMYTFEKAGFPPVPQYPFAAIIENFKQGINYLLRGVALRMEALRSCGIAVGMYTLSWRSCGKVR